MLRWGAMRASIQLFPLGHVAMAARTWRRRGRVLLTVIVKGTFDLRHDGAMTIAAPAPIVLEDRAISSDPIASLARQSDLALVVPRPEVTLVGSAFAGRGRLVPSLTVELRAQRDRTTLFDKRLDVVGDRRATPGGPVPAPTPFERMPIRYERAFGGITSRENPVGRGLLPDADGLVSLPNVLLPQGGGHAPAGFGAISGVWPRRTALRGTFSPQNVGEHGDLEVPDDFDESYFQAAPADQRVGDLQGGDVLTLVHLHPELETLRTALPALRGVALLETGRRDRSPIALRIDTVHLEPEAMRAEIVHRGALTVTEEQLRDLRIAGAFEPLDRPFSFPELATLRASPSTPPPRPASAHASTMVLEPTAPPRPTFSGTMVLEVDGPPRPTTPPERAPVPPPPAAATMPMPPSLPAAASTPFVSSASGTPRTSASVASKEEPATEGVARHATMFLDADDGPKPSLPFGRGKRRRSGQIPAVVASKAATPWAAAPASRPAPTAEGITSTLVVDEPAAAADAATPSPAIAAEPAPAPPPPDPNKSPWREEAGALPVAGPTAAPKQVLPPRTDVRGTLYKKPKR